MAATSTPGAPEEVNPSNSWPMAIPTMTLTGSQPANVAPPDPAMPSGFRRWVASISGVAVFCAVVWYWYANEPVDANDSWQHGMVVAPLEVLAVLFVWHTVTTQAMLRSHGRLPSFLMKVAMSTASATTVLLLPALITCIWVGLCAPLTAIKAGLHACLATTACSIPGALSWWTMTTTSKSSTGRLLRSAKNED
jgi:hypothetical protein